MTTQQQTERERLADDLEKICAGEWVEGADAKFRRIAALLRGDEPAKPDRYMTTAYEVWNTYTHEGPGAAAAVLRRHFEPSAEVVEAAKFMASFWPNKREKILANFILKGDQ